jgi:hypothetical protein
LAGDLATFILAEDLYPELDMAGLKTLNVRLSIKFSIPSYYIIQLTPGIKIFHTFHITEQCNHSLPTGHNLNKEPFGK